MSVIKNNPLLKGASGMLGNVIVYRELRGKLIMSNKPKKVTSLSEAQQTARSRFQRAAFYAKRQMSNPETKALYATGVNDSKFTAFVVALTDYLKAPVIHEVDASAYTGASGQAIDVKATDDFQVKSVQVSIDDPTGVSIEKGEATLTVDAPEQWRYITTAVASLLPGTKITAYARDVAGNVTAFEILK